MLQTETTVACLSFCFFPWKPQRLCHVQGQQPSILSARLLTSLTHWQSELSGLSPAGCSSETHDVWSTGCVQRGIKTFPLRAQAGEEQQHWHARSTPGPHALTLHLGQQTSELCGFHVATSRGQVGSACRKWKKSLLFCRMRKELARLTTLLSSRTVQPTTQPIF